MADDAPKAEAKAFMESYAQPDAYISRLEEMLKEPSEMVSISQEEYDRLREAADAWAFMVNRFPYLNRHEADGQ